MIFLTNIFLIIKFISFDFLSLFDKIHINNEYLNNLINRNFIAMDLLNINFNSTEKKYLNNQRQY